MGFVFIKTKFYKINIKNLKYYCLTITDNVNRHQHINNTFKDFNFNFVYTKKHDKNISKFQSGAIGISKIFDIAINNFKSKNIFEPFIIIEDDVSITNYFKDYIDIPSNTDLLYLGISNWGFIDKPLGIKGYIYASSVENDISQNNSNSNTNVIKIKNMLSTHAILINSFSGLLMYQKAMIDALINNRHYDIPQSLLQPFYNIYALTKPFFYQDISMGGQPGTNLEITNNDYKSEIFINHKINNLNKNLILRIHD